MFAVVLLCLYLAVDSQFHLQIVRVAYLFAEDQGRARGCECVEAFSPEPLFVCELDVSCTYVVEDSVSGDVIERI
jgi:hypothetical protein